MPGSLTPAEVARVAELARLELSLDEAAHYAEQLSAVLDHVEALRRLDTAGVAPTAHAFELVNVLRPDEVVPGLARDAVLAQAPAVEDRRFRVPRILGEVQ